MENNQFWRPLLLALCLCASFNPASAQMFENTFVGSPSTGETAQDSKPLPDGRYATLSNTRMYAHPNGSQIMLTILNTDGSVAMNVAIKEPVSYINHYFGTALEVDLDALGKHIGFYIAGYRQIGTDEQAILIRTDAKGSVLWTKVLPNNVAGLELQGRAVSVERQSDGDVIVTGTHPSQSTYQKYYFFAARFRSSGATEWSNRYHSETYNHSFEAVEACNGERSGDAVIAVTGRMRTSGSEGHRTFLSCIDAVTGAEIWRRSYASSADRDSGNDVVYKSAGPAGSGEPAAFMVVGATGGIHSLLWVIRANPLNGLSSSKVYAPIIPNSITFGFHGTAVSLDLTGTKAAITGPLLFDPANSGFESGTFAMVLPFYGTEMPDWTRYYYSSSPQQFGQNSISYVKDATDPGYLIGCGVTSPFSNTGAVHAIRTDASGGTGLKGCNTLRLEVNRRVEGNQVWRPFVQYSTAWTSIFLTQFDRDFREQFCNDGVLIPKVANSGNATPALPGEVQIAPNPSGAGAAVEAVFDAPQSGRVRLRLMDISGREIWSQEQEVEAGTSRMALPTDLLKPGVYLLHFSSPWLDKVEKMARM